jgi:hypothetical protein
MFLIMGLIAGLFAFGFFVGAPWAYFSQQYKMKSRVAAVGTVVELTSRITASGRANIICPVVEFSAPSGEKIRFTSEFGSLPAKHQVGQTVNVRYDPVDPKNAEIDSAMNLWLIPLILVFMGSIACCLSVAFLGAYKLGPS